MWTRRLTIVSGVLAAAACGSERPGPPTDVTTVEGPVAGVLSDAHNCGHYAPSLYSFTVRWSCGAQIKIDTAGSSIAGFLWDAAGEWNNAWPAGYNLPQFVLGTSTPKVTGSGTNSGTVTGSVSGLGTSSMNVNLGSGSGSGSGSVLAITVHEFSHIVGFGDGWESGGGAGVSGVSDHCVRQPNASGSTYAETTLCQHEIEYVLYAYGVRSTVPSLSKHIVTGLVGLPSSISLYAPQADTVTITYFQTLRGNPTTVCSDDCVVTPPTGSISFATSNASVATVSGSGASRIITAAGPGTATITLSVSDTDYEAGGLMRDTFVVTVTNPPEPHGFTIGYCKILGGGTYVNYGLFWAAGTGNWEIRHSNVNNVATAPTLVTGPVSQTSAFWAYNIATEGPNRYWWIRQTSPVTGSWVSNAANGQVLADGCIF